MSDTSATGLELVLVTGISGSGKSVVLHALEDAGFFCVDNLPPELLDEFLRVERERQERQVELALEDALLVGELSAAEIAARERSERERLARRMAVAVDVRSAGSLPALLPLLERLRGEGVAVRCFFLDATTDTLVRRFSETRRPHPLSADASRGAASRHALTEAIELERELLAELREVSTVIDTSQLRPAQLRQWVRDVVGIRSDTLTLVFESFAYKYGVPLDADFVFDVRVLPNPYYIRELRPLTGRDAGVADYLAAQPEAGEMLDQIEAFLAHWLAAFAEDQRSYLTVAIGCTGGQHRSVYIAERLAERFATRAPTLRRHRELDARD
jgi:UPF0042 nucleotide-binding protein